MSHTNILQQTILIACDEVKSALKSKRAIITFISYIALFILIGMAFNQLYARAMEQAQSYNFNETELKRLMKAVGAEVERNSPRMEYLFTIPVAALFTFLLNFIFTSSLTIILGFDAISQEYASQSIRYILIRVSRLTFYLGKLLGQIFIVLGILNLAFMLVVLLSMFKIPSQQIGPLIFHSLKYDFYLSLYAICQISFVLLISSLIQRPMLALLTASFSPIILYVVALKHFSFLLPFKYIQYVFDPEPSKVFIAAAAWMLFTSFNLGVALVIFSKRDL